MRQARFDMRGKIVLMAKADGYVMVRRPWDTPYVMSMSDWLRLPVMTKG